MTVWNFKGLMMLDNFQTLQLTMYQGFVFLTNSKKRLIGYQLVVDLMTQGAFYFIRYSKHSPVFYCFKTKEDYYALPQRFEIIKLRTLKKICKPIYRQTTIFDFGA